MVSFKALGSKIYPLLIIVFIAFFARLPFLGSIPAGLSDDEMTYIMNAKAVFLTGKNWSAAWSPLDIVKKIDAPHTELPHLINAPLFGLLPSTLFTARLTYFFINIALVVLLFLITQKLIGNHEAFFVGLVAALNPWSIFFSHTIFEHIPAVFFYLLTFYMLLLLRGWRILFALIPLSLAFHVYVGTKVIYIPFAIISSFYAWFIVNKKKYTTQYVIIVLFSIITFIIFALTLKEQSLGNRMQELWTPNNPMVNTMVNDERRLTVSNPLSTILSNKFIVYGKESLGKYMSVFSPNFLFTNGEARSTFSLYKHGYFYYIDAIFFILGFCVLFQKKKKVWALLTAFLIISPLPAVANWVGNGFAAVRGVLLYPIVMMFSGIGLWYGISQLKKTALFLPGVFVLICTYLYLCINFFNIFLFQYPIYASEAYSMSSRIVSHYISKIGKTTPVIVISGFPEDNFRHYLFYTNIYDKKSAKQLSKQVKEKNYSFQNVSFMFCKDIQTIDPNTIYIVESGLKCPMVEELKKIPHLTIPQLSDGGEIFFIVHDPVCHSFDLKRYPYNLSLSDISVESLPVKRFCETYITDYYRH